MNSPRYFWHVEFEVVEKSREGSDKTIGFITLNKFNRLTPIVLEEGLSELDKHREKVLLSRLIPMITDSQKMPSLSEIPTEKEFEEWQRDKRMKADIHIATLGPNSREVYERWIGVEGVVSITRFYPE